MRIQALTRYSVTLHVLFGTFVLGVQGQGNSSSIQATCKSIATTISNASEVFYPSSPQYTSDNLHAFVTSSEASACSVEPGSAKDVGAILRIISTTRTPFAVKGGGHATNPGFSSTKGIEISMTRFNQTSFNRTGGTVDVGPGLTWDQVYDELDSVGVSVIGGRIPGVGVAGLTLGGGYSYKTSQFGLALDNIEAYELVFPNGTIATITSKDEDLWFALRGGMNNFGIITKFTLTAHQQGQVWGGVVLYSPDQVDAVKTAIVNFQERVNDTKAVIGISLAFESPLGISPSAILFYDGPTPPEGTFDDFLALQSVQSNVSSRSYADFVHSTSSESPDPGVRGLYSTVPVTNYSTAFMDAVINQTSVWGERLTSLDKNALLAIGIEPFSHGMLTHGRPSAYPPNRSQALFPTLINPLWTNSSLDGFVVDMLHNISGSLHAAALADKQNVSDAAAYINYALFDTPVEDMYGANVPRLRAIKHTVDPNDVMGLAGGFKL
ncbi:FAD-binding domain-containing protein [Gloeopeniophorella convolvens]|nr:FAD-binding domain-containing protein [Gloeopeniophorella convolvens]